MSNKEPCYFCGANVPEWVAPKKPDATLWVCPVSNQNAPDLAELLGVLLNVVDMINDRRMSDSELVDYIKSEIKNTRKQHEKTRL